MPPSTASDPARLPAPRADRDDRDAVAGRHREHGLDLLGALDQHHRVGRPRAQVRLVAAVDLAALGIGEEAGPPGTARRGPPARRLDARPSPEDLHVRTRSWRRARPGREGDHLRDVLRRHLRRERGRRQHLGVHAAGRHRQALHPGAAELLGQALGEADEPPLGRVVRAAPAACPACPRSRPWFTMRPRRAPSSRERPRGRRGTGPPGSRPAPRRNASAERSSAGPRTRMPAPFTSTSHRAERALVLLAQPRARPASLRTSPATASAAPAARTTSSSSRAGPREDGHPQRRAR